MRPSHQVDNWAVTGFTTRLVRHTVIMSREMKKHTSSPECSLKPSLRSEVEEEKRSEEVKLKHEPSKAERELIRMSIHPWLPADSGPAWSAPAVRLQTSCRFIFTIQLVSRNLLPEGGQCHWVELVLISKQTDHRIPATPPDWGKGSKHGAEYEAWSGKAASVGVAGTIQFDMVRKNYKYNHKNNYTIRLRRHQHNPMKE